MYNQPAADRLHCGLLIQGFTTETRIFMVKNPIDLSWVSRRITLKMGGKYDSTEFVIFWSVFFETSFSLLLM